MDVLEPRERLVTAPNETYLNLFWPGDTGPLDQFIKTQKRKEQDKQRKAEVQKTNPKDNS